MGMHNVWSVVKRSDNWMDRFKYQYDPPTQIAIEYVHAGLTIAEYEHLMGNVVTKVDELQLTESVQTIWNRACGALRELNSRQTQAIQRYLNYCYGD